MKSTSLQAAVGAALLLVQPASASTAHRHAHDLFNSKRHSHSHEELVQAPLNNRGFLYNRAGECPFPSNGENLVAITRDSMNRGWAMSPDQECTRGSYCPIACKPGMVMAQWQPNSSYVYPQSMNGGLYCDEHGVVQKPYPDRDYCVEGTGNVNVVNKCGKNVAICQTVLPGNEAMLIPTNIVSTSGLACPGPDYWDGTAAHFYVNPPGYTTDEACVWGTPTKSIGNWTPYVLGANTDANGLTYVKIGWNPKYLDDLSGSLPTFGVKIECDGNCNGLPCAIDPSTNGLNGVTSNNAAAGAGSGKFCVVTASKGTTVNIVLFNTGGSTGESTSSSAQSTTSSAPKLKTLAIATPTSSQPSTTTTSSSTSTSSSSSRSSTTISSFSSTSSSSSRPSSSSSSSASVNPGIFQENATTTHSQSSSSSSSSSSSATITSSASLVNVPAETAAAATTSSKSDGANPHKGSSAIVGLIVAFMAATFLY